MERGTPSGVPPLFLYAQAWLRPQAAPVSISRVDEPEFERPKPPKVALTVHELRKVVTARHKYLLTTKSWEEGVELLQDEYHADDHSCENFLTWIRGGEPHEPPTKGGAVERTHIVADPETGEQRYVETQPGSIPPRAPY